LERFCLHFRHSGFNAQFPGLAIGGKYFRQRRCAREDRNSFLSKVRLKANDCLGGKIRNE
jgi:hypothetical protein